jgi:hypothetical protein
LVFALFVASPAAGSDLAELTAVLERVLAHERYGGWGYVASASGRPEPATDLLRAAERIAGPLGLARWQVVVLRSPGTSAAGLVLLAAHRLTGRAEYLAAARRAGDLLIAVQLGSGGWFSEVAVHEGRMPRWYVALARRTSIDDDVTPGAVRLLLALFEATGEAGYREAAERGIACLLGAQLPSGAWPLVLRPGWERAILDSFEDQPSLNDGATTAAIDTLLVAARTLGRDDLLAAARRGGDWLLQARGAPPQAGWAAQYNGRGEPAPARYFEPAAFASWETRYALDTLIGLAAATGDRRYCAPVADAVAWLERSALQPGCWARFYEPGTNAPLYLAADGIRVADPAAARSGYTWRGPFGIPALLSRLGRPAPGPVAPIPPLAGAPGTCPGDEPIGVRRDDPADPRAQISRAGRLLAALVPPPPPACRLEPAGEDAVHEGPRR